MTGSSAIDAVGNTLANVITGNAGNNIIDGGAGADTMIGGLGNDTYTVDNVGDVVTEVAGGGTDVINSSVTFTLSTEVETLNLTGSLAINGTGNTVTNTIVGNGAANIISGGLGNDTMTGGGGADYFVFNSAPNGTSNVDTITDFTQNTDLLQFSKAVFTAVTTAAGAGVTLAAGNALSGTEFISGAGRITAATTAQHFIYNTTDGALYYDADGSTATIAAIKVAIIGTSSHPGLVAGDIHIIA